HFVTAEQVRAIRNIPHVSRVDAFALASVSVAGAATNLTLVVLGPDDQTWDSLGGPAPADRFGVVLSEQQALRLGVIDRPLDRPALGWDKLPGKKAIGVRTRSQPAAVPVLLVARDLESSLGRDGVMGRRTQWLLDHWEPAFSLALTDPAGEPLARPAR